MPPKALPVGRRRLEQGETFVRPVPNLEEEANYTYARTVAANGAPNRVVVRERMADGTVRITRAGQRFFREEVVLEITPRIPTIKCYNMKDKGEVKYRPSLDPTRYLPLDDDFFTSTHAIPMAQFRYNPAQIVQDVDRTVQEEVMRFIDSCPTVEQHINNAAERGLKDFLNHRVILDEYSGIEIYDPTREILKDERVTGLEGNGALNTETLLDRPLRNIHPYVPDWLDRVGLSEHALRVPAGRSCIHVQLEQCLQKRCREDSRNCKEHTVPMYTSQEIADLLSEAWAECGYEAGRMPFETGTRGQDWRQLGVTLKMPRYAADTPRTPFRIMVFVQGRYVWQHVPAKVKGNTKHTPVIAMAVHGDHGFLYGAERAGELAERFKSHTQSAVHTAVRLHNPYKPHESDFDITQAKPFCVDDVKAAIAAKATATFYDVDLDEAAVCLREAGVQFHEALGTTPSKIIGLYITQNVVVRHVPKQWAFLHKLCEVVSDVTRFKPKYRGQSLSVLSLQLLNEFITQGGRTNLAGERQRVRDRQQNLCAKCSSELSDGAAHLDHKQPLAENGADDESNLQLLCATCHCEKTSQEEKAAAPYDSLFGPSRGLMSQLSPQLHRLFHGPHAKPRQLSGFVDAVEATHCYDIRGSRKNALEQCGAPLPTFCFSDELEALEGYRPGYDYYVLDDHRPWCSRAVELRLRAGTIAPQQVKYGLKASGHVDVARFKAACDTLRACVVQTLERYPILGEGARDPVKECVLSAIGLFNTSTLVTWFKTRSDFSADHPGPGRVRRRRAAGGGPEWELLDSTEHKTLISWRPIGQIALTMEIARVELLAAAIRQNPLCTLQGYGIDAVNFAAAPGFEQSFGHGLNPATFQYEDGQSVYRLEQDYFQPLWPLKRTPAPIPDLQFKTWASVREPSVDEAFQLLLSHKGGFITGPAGSGKSYLLTRPGGVIARLEAQGFKVAKMAWTHFAAMIIGGKDGQTMSHFLLSHQRALSGAHKLWLIVDEVSQLPLKIFPLLAAYQFLGLAGCICLGDFQQMLPIAEGWGTNAFLRLENCQGFCELVGGLRLEMCECRRSDREHYQYYCSLRAGLMSRVHLAQRYPWDPAKHHIDVCICLKHSTREKVGTLLNEEQAARAMGVARVKPSPGLPLLEGTTMEPHSSFLGWPGMKMVGCKRSHNNKVAITNGITYEIVSLDSTHVTAQAEGGGEVKLTQHEAIQYLRLYCARTYASCQGATFQGRVLLLDSDHRFVDNRSLYVGLSRVTTGDKLHIPTLEQLREWRKSHERQRLADRSRSPRRR